MKGLIILNVCPNCGRIFNIDHYKKRGNCSECGFQFKLAPPKEPSIAQYNAVMRKQLQSASTAEDPSKTRLVQVSPKDLSQSVCKPRISTSKDKNSGGCCPTTDMPVLKKGGVAAPEPASPAAISPADMVTNSYEGNPASEDIEDAIFLNSKTIYFDDVNETISSQKQPGIPDQPGITDQPGLSDQPEIPDQPDLSGQPGQSDDSSSASSCSKLSNFFVFQFIYQTIERRKSLKEEQLECDIPFDSNKDGYYNDTPPDVPPDIDIISLNSILKFVGVLFGIFAFISFIIYWA